MEFADYIFDLYGTLVDIRTDENATAFWRRAALYFAMQGADYSPKELRASYLRLCAGEQAKSPDPLCEIELRNVFSALYREKGLQPDEALVASAAVSFRLLSVKKLRLYPWVKTTLARIRAKGSRIFLLSNAQACFTRPELTALGLANEFDGILLSSEAGVKKPSPKIMRRLLETYGIDPGNCLMAGNDQKADIALALSFKMEALYIETETSAPYDPALAVPRELLGGSTKRLHELLGLEEK